MIPLPQLKRYSIQYGFKIFIFNTPIELRILAVKHFNYNMGKVVFVNKQMDRI